MTEQQATAAPTDAPAASANGRGPVPPAAGPGEADTGERWLAALVIAAGLFLLFVGIDRATGGALTGAFSGDSGGEGG